MNHTEEQMEWAARALNSTVGCVLDEINRSKFFNGGSLSSIDIALVRPGEDGTGDDCESTVVLYQDGTWKVTWNEASGRVLRTAGRRFGTSERLV